jgi:hypothetical protein
LLWEQDRRALGQRIAFSTHKWEQEQTAWTPGYISSPSRLFSYAIEIQIGEMLYEWDGDVCGERYEGATCSLADGLSSSRAEQEQELGQYIAYSVHELEQKRGALLPSQILRIVIKIQIGNKSYGWDGDVCGTQYEGVTCIRETPNCKEWMKMFEKIARLHKARLTCGMFASAICWTYSLCKGAKS